MYENYKFAVIFKLLTKKTGYDYKINILLHYFYENFIYSSVNLSITASLTPIFENPPS